MGRGLDSARDVNNAGWLWFDGTLAFLVGFVLGCVYVLVNKGRS